MRVVLLASAITVASGCLGPTEVVLAIDTDVSCDAVSRHPVEIAVGPYDTYETLAPSASTTACSARGHVGTLVLVPSPRKDKIGVRVALSAQGGPCDKAHGYAGCVVARRLVAFVSHTRLDLPIKLTSSCVDVPCDEKSTCVDGACRSLETGACSSRCGDGGASAPPTYPLPLPAKILGVTAGGRSACARFADGTARCWGENADGQLALPAVTMMTTPTLSPALMGFQRIDMGGRHACGIDGSGQTRCWGNNDFGQLGVGAITTPKDAPQIASVTKALDVRAGAAHACMIDAQSNVSCWGRTAQTGVASGALAPSPIGVAATQIALGDTHSCALRSGPTSLACWGVGSKGQAGQTSPLYPTPETVTGLPQSFDLVGVGAAHTCVASQNQTVAWCFGDNSTSQLGGPANTNENPPFRTVNLAGPVVMFALGSSHSCALDQSGNIDCWGARALGQLGDGQSGASAPPAEIRQRVTLPFASLTGVDAGDDFTCAFSDAHLACWGDDARGQIGDGSSGGVVDRPFLIY